MTLRRSINAHALPVLLQILHAALAHSVIFYAIFVLSKASWSPLPTIKGPDGKSASLLYGVQLTRVSKKLVSKGVILSAKDVQQASDALCWKALLYEGKSCAG